MVKTNKNCSCKVIKIDDRENMYVLNMRLGHLENLNCPLMCKCEWCVCVCVSSVFIAFAQCALEIHV